MSSILCCYKQRQHFNTAGSLFAQSARCTFRLNACTKTCAPLHDCRISNSLIQFVPSCQDTQTHTLHSK